MSVWGRASWDVRMSCRRTSMVGWIAMWFYQNSVSDAVVICWVYSRGMQRDDAMMYICGMSIRGSGWQQPESSSTCYLSAGVRCLSDEMSATSSSRLYQNTSIHAGCQCYSRRLQDNK
jgi:hypothetical protein